MPGRELGRGEPRASGWLKRYTARYPKAWKLAENVLARRGSEFPDWPEWCFLPLPAGIEMARNGGEVEPEGSVEAMLEASRLVALAPWRMTKGVYALAPDVLGALWGTPIEGGGVPHEVLYRLPEWCAYVETPGKTLPMGEDGEQREIAGFFAHLNSYEGMGFSELRIVLDVPNEGEGDPYLFPLFLGLTEPTLEECLLADATRSAEQHAESTGREPYEPEDILAHLTGLVGPPLSLILYLCTSAEVRNVDPGGREGPGNPAPRRIRKKGAKLFAANEVTRWSVT